MNKLKNSNKNYNQGIVSEMQAQNFEFFYWKTRKKNPEKSVF